MLVLTRKTNEAIAIGPDIAVTVLRIERGKVRLGISAPSETPIARTELLPGASRRSPRSEDPAPSAA
jgi:carbon storage regulator